MSGENILYILTILEAIEKINLYINEIESALDFYHANDQLNFNAVVNLLIVIGEESKKIDKKVKDNYGSIDWQSITAMRNELTHNYRGIDYELVWDVVLNHLDELKKVCSTIIIAMINSKIVTKQELQEFVNSDYYFHLKYLIDKVKNE